LLSLTNDFGCKVGQVRAARSRFGVILMTDSRGGRYPGQAVVIGGSLAGLLAARVLADHFDRVTLLERDRYPAEPGPRKGVPQARHLHVLLVRGQSILERLFPGLRNDLIARGASLIDAARDLAWLTPAGWGPRFDSQLRYVACSRDLIDWAVQRRVAALPNITIREDVDVAGLLPSADGRAIAGVELRSRDAAAGRGMEQVTADLVVDTAGRSSRAPQWLEALGYPAPAETVVNAFLGYASRIYRRPAGHSRDWQGFYVQSAPPNRTRAGVIFPIEGGRWQVTVGGGGRDYPPTDEAGFLDFAHSLPAPEFAKAVAAAEPLTQIVGHRNTENRLRHYERLARRPERFLVTGDAACAFNPVYGQGMTTAALGAEVLDRCLRDGRSAGDFTGLARRFQRALARSNAVPWLLSTSEDYRIPTTEGPPPGPSTRLLHLYFDRVLDLGIERPPVRKAMLEVIHLIRSPAALFRPSITGRVLWRALRRRPRPAVN
jgi:2-polyprenyl-6-methoxyphenol hydroxylase-like FAD-dependent oxidoreductase